MGGQDDESSFDIQYDNMDESDNDNSQTVAPPAAKPTPQPSVTKTMVGPKPLLQPPMAKQIIPPRPILSPVPRLPQASTERQMIEDTDMDIDDEDGSSSWLFYSLIGMILAILSCIAAYLMSEALASSENSSSSGDQPIPSTRYSEEEPLVDGGSWIPSLDIDTSLPLSYLSTDLITVPLVSLSSAIVALWPSSDSESVTTSSDSEVDQQEQEVLAAKLEEALAKASKRGWDSDEQSAQKQASQPTARSSPPTSTKVDSEAEARSERERRDTEAAAAAAQAEHDRRLREAQLADKEHQLATRARQLADERDQTDRERRAVAADRQSLADERAAFEKERRLEEQLMNQERKALDNDRRVVELERQELRRRESDLVMMAKAELEAQQATQQRTEPPPPPPSVARESPSAPTLSPSTVVEQPEEVVTSPPTPVPTVDDFGWSFEPIQELKQDLPVTGGGGDVEEDTCPRDDAGFCINRGDQPPDDVDPSDNFYQPQYDDVDGKRVFVEEEEFW